jgi:L,D-transpeptidase-like protein
MKEPASEGVPGTRDPLARGLPRPGRRWIDRALSVALLLIAALVLAPLAGALMGRDEPPLRRPPFVAASPETRSELSPSPASADCARESVIGTVLRSRTVARGIPARSAKAVHAFSKMTALGSPQVFLLQRQVVGQDGATWYQALLPIRPKGTTGFIPGRDLEVRTTPYRLELDRKRFRLRLFDGCRLLKAYRVGIGTGRTPTPVGRFYLTSLIKLPDPGTVYGPYAYGLSGYSEVLDTWKLGGIIGLHGTNDPSSIGRRSSHGCIRLRNRDIRALVKILPLGTPIAIH